MLTVKIILKDFTCFSRNQSLTIQYFINIFYDKTIQYRIKSVIPQSYFTLLFFISINLLVVYRESVNLIGYLTRRLSADSQQL